MTEVYKLLMNTYDDNTAHLDYTWVQLAANENLHF